MKRFSQRISRLCIGTASLTAMMVFSSCEQEFFPCFITVHNNTVKVLRLYDSNGIVYPSVTFYPDTLLPKGLSPNARLGDERGMVDVLSYVYPHSLGNAYFNTTESDIEKSLRSMKSDTLSIFLINNDTLHVYGYEYIAEHSKYEVRYDLSVSDLRSLGYAVEYPPSPQMAGMKMWPKYDSFKQEK